MMAVIAWIQVMWPQVLPNLIASAITGTLAWLWARAKFRAHAATLERHHRELLDAHRGLATQVGEREPSDPDDGPVDVDRRGFFAP